MKYHRNINLYHPHTTPSFTL